jgi:hypothetical protein
MRPVFLSQLIVGALQPLAAQQTAAPVRGGVAIRGIVTAQNDAVLPRVRVMAVLVETVDGNRPVVARHSWRGRMAGRGRAAVARAAGNACALGESQTLALDLRLINR